MKKRFRIGFLVALLCIIALSAALVVHPTPQSWAMIVNAISGLTFVAGAVVVTYKYPVSGTTAPTVLQAQGCNELNAIVSALDADTVITITHNWHLPSGDATSLFPIVSVIGNSDSTGTIQPVFILSFTSSDVVTINKPTIVGTQGTFIVVVARPNTFFR